MSIIGALYVVLKVAFLKFDCDVEISLFYVMMLSGMG